MKKIKYWSVFTLGVMRGLHLALQARWTKNPAKLLRLQQKWASLEKWVNKHDYTYKGAR